METKLLEIRDSGTHIDCLAIKLSSADGYIASHAGVPPDAGSIYLLRLHSPQCQYDPYEWDRNNRTMHEAHLFIRDNWESIKSEDIIDVEHILNESEHKKCSDRFYPTQFEKDLWES